jgi:signal transduction histidine kinase
MKLDTVMKTLTLSTLTQRRALALLGALMVLFTLGTMAAILGNVAAMDHNRSLVYRTLALDIGQIPMNYLISRDDFPTRKLMIILALSVSGILLACNGALFYLLYRTNQRLNDAERTKSNMISAITHDARFYLTVLKGRIDLMRMKLEEGIPLLKSSEDLQIASENTVALSRLLVNLSDHELLSQGRMPVYPLNTDLKALLERLLVTVRFLLQDRRVNVQWEPADASFMMVTDARLAEQIVLNLLHNAHKFSPADRPVDLKLISFGGAFHLYVHDFGEGVAVGDRTRLFQPFTKFHPTIKGNGLGLSNARQIARLLHGDLQLLESHPALGTTFLLTLPRTWAENPDEKIPA